MSSNPLLSFHVITHNMCSNPRGAQFVDIPLLCDCSTPSKHPLLHPQVVIRLCKQDERTDLKRFLHKLKLLKFTVSKIKSINFLLYFQPFVVVFCLLQPFSVNVSSPRALCQPVPNI